MNQIPKNTKTPKVRHSMFQPIFPAVLAPDDAAAFVGLGRTAFDVEMKAPDAPKPRKLSGRRVGYLVAELLTWLHTRPVSNLPPPKNSGFGRAGKPKT